MTSSETSLAQTGAHTVGTRVWLADPAEGWVKADVVEVLPDAVTIKLQNGQTRKCEATDLPLQNPGKYGVEDMTTLSYLSEPTVLWNLRMRYDVDDIYTYTGSILIAVNPFAPMPHLYGAHMMVQYRGTALGELSPHVYAVADAAYRQMRLESRSQSILVSGESGAGKTETSKLIMQYLAWMGGYDADAAAAGGEARSVEQQVLESNPLLEAFGNAKTSRNDNSSRFGKFTEIQFGADGRISGAAIRTYLLERSRVVSVGSPERNYHVFYQLCDGASAEEATSLGLVPAREFRYLNQSDCFELDGFSNAEDYARTRRAMTLVGLDEATQDAVFSVVAAVLHLGNITFDPDASGDGCVPTASAEHHVVAAARLLGAGGEDLVKALATRTRQTPDGPIVSPLDARAASDNRDSLAKTLYARLFDWLVAAINKSIGQDASAETLIGVLDIYGFEQFASNDFEQFCINLANEKLQQHFNAHVFKQEQAEYEREEIQWSYIEFVDNQDVLDLIEARMGILDLLDETCRFPNATNEDLATKLYTAPTVSSSGRFTKPKLSRTDFTIDHYAGAVTYKTDNFLAKNRDFVVAEHQALLGESSVEFVKMLFAEEKSGVEGSGGNTRAASSYRFSSVGSRFKRQLAELMEALRAMEPHYVRCIKPNGANQPAAFENVNVLHQLRCGGVLEAVRISCAGYPTKLPYEAFADHFWPLAVDGPDVANDAELARYVVERHGDAESAQFGKTKLFLRAGRMAELDKARTDLLNASATKLQAAVRRYLALSTYQRVRSAIITIQAAERGRVARQAAQDLRRERAAIVVQKYARRWRARSELVASKRAATVLQSAWRGRQARLAFTDIKRVRAAVHVQSAWRMSRERRAFLRLKAGTLAAQTCWRRRLAVRELRQRRTMARDTGKLRADKEALETRVKELDRIVGNVQQQRNELRAALREERAARESAETRLRDALVRAADAEAAVEVRAALAEAKREIDAVKVSAKEEIAAKDARLAALQAQIEDVAKKESALAQREKALEAAKSDAERRAAAQVQDLMTRLNNALTQRNAAREEALMVEARLKAVLEEERTMTPRKKAAVQDHHETLVTPTRPTTAAAAGVAAATNGGAQMLDSSSLLATSGMLDRVRRYMSSPQRTPDTSGLSEMDRRQRELYAKQQALLREQRAADQERLLRCVIGGGTNEDGPSGPLTTNNSLGFFRGRPVAALLIFRCCLQWRTFQADRTPLFDRLISAMGSVVEAGADDNRVLAYWLSNTATLLYLLQRNIKPAGGGPGGYTARLRAQGQSLAQRGGISGFFSRAAGYGSPGSTSSAASPSHGEASIHGGAAGGLRQVEAKYPALLFRQQLDAFVQKIFPSLRDNIKRDIMPHLAACIHAPRGGAVGIHHQHTTSAGLSRRSGGTAAQQGSDSTTGKSPWTAVLDVLDAALATLRENHVPPFLVRRLFEQLFSFINVQLFNQLLLRRECCSFTNGEYVKTGLAEVEIWIGGAGRAWVGEVWEALSHIRQAVQFLVIHQKHKKSLEEITTDLCPMLTVQQLYRISTMYWDDRYGTETVSHEVLSRMKALMVESAASAASHSFLLDEDSALPFTQEDIASQMDDKDLLGEMPIPPALKDQPSFAFLNKRLELALQSAA